MLNSKLTGLLVTAALLGALVLAAPIAVSAQAAPAQLAMVEGNASDINSWGFAEMVPVGASITWTNLGSQAHTATASDASFDSGLVAPGASATIDFPAPGVFPYICTPHPWMKGFVIVSENASNESPAMAMVEGNVSDINSWGFAVSVQAGQSVAWTNQGTQAHTATAADGSFDTGLVQPGETGSVQFDTPGVFAYVCTPHPWMKGNVAVNPLG
jgi:plastocyanin